MCTYLYVANSHKNLTGFAITNCIVTITEIHFITSTVVSRHGNSIAIMARSAFTDSFLPTLSSHEESQQSLRSHWGVLLRQMGCQSAPSVHHPGLFYGLSQLWLFLSTTEQTAWLPVFSDCLAHSPTPPLICDTHDIPKASQKPAISTRCHLCAYI